MALDTSYGAVGRLRRFNSCILPLPLFPASLSHFKYSVLAVFLRVFSYGFSQVFPLGIGCSPACVGSYSEYAEFMPFPRCLSPCLSPNGTSPDLHKVQ